MPSTAQVITIDEARDQGPESTVTVEGTVTRAFGDFVRFQDESGPTGASGLVIRQTSGGFRDSVQSGAITGGTELQVTGTLSEFNGLLQINEGELDDFSVQGQGPVPAPQDVDLATIRSDGELYESELVRVTGNTFLQAEGTFENRTSYIITDGSGTETFTEGTLAFRVQGTGETEIAGDPIPPGTVEYTGVVGEFRSEFQLIPIRTDDLQPVRSFGFARQFAQAAEGSGTVEVDVRAFAMESGDEVSVTASLGAESTADVSDVNGIGDSQTLTFSGSDPAPETLSFDPLDDGTPEGVERLEVVLESDDGALARPQRFTLWILDEPDVQMRIAEGDSGDALLESLQEQFSDPRPLGDDLARDSMYAVVYSKEGNTVEGQYSGFQITVDPSEGDPSAIAAEKGINNEHMWPQSQGAREEPATSDMHILAPARDVVNSARSNFPFGEIPDADTDTWYFEDQSQSGAPPESERPAWSELLNGDRFEPRHSVKGDAARAVFYFVTIYPNRANLTFFEEQRETLLEWHERDPVDATEMRRNLIQASFQDNVANPYVLDSTLADRALGSGGGDPGGGLLTIQEARDQGAGASVEVEGTVTRAFGAFARIQDESGSEGAGGLTIRQTSGPNADAFQQDIEDDAIRPGTRIRVRGNLSAFNGLLQVNDDDLANFEIIEQGDPPSPQSVTLTDLQAPGGEAFESVLVRLDDLSFPEASGTFQGGTTYTVEDAGGTEFEFRVQDETETDVIGTSIPGGAFDFEGVIGQFNGAGFDAEEPDEGYQLIPMRPSDLETSFITVNVERSFGGATGPAGYRLVALPGQVDRPLAEAVSGEAGSQWQAFWDDGSDDDFLVRFDETDDRFSFAPGNGFWLTATEPWRVEGQFEPVVEDEGQDVSIPLNDGWTIVSNPRAEAVGWAAIEAANENIEQPLLTFEGEDGFQQASTMASAREGIAYYFANAASLESLVLPAPSSTEQIATKSEDPDRLVLRAEAEAGPASTVEIGTSGEERHVLAPPGRFQAVQLRIVADSTAGGRTPYRLVEQRPVDRAGETVRLRLVNETDGPVELTSRNVEAIAEDAVVLRVPATGTTHSLDEPAVITIPPSDEPTELQLSVGTESYVEQRGGAALPTEVSLSTYPNPVRQRGTIAYSLPDAQDVQVHLYDVLGRRVMTLENAQQEAGDHQISFNGARLPSGTYFLRLQTQNGIETEQITVVR